jgi:hypothetical protein
MAQTGEGIIGWLGLGFGSMLLYSAVRGGPNNALPVLGPHGLLSTTVATGRVPYGITATVPRAPGGSASPTPPGLLDRLYHLFGKAYTGIPIP